MEKEGYLSAFLQYLQIEKNYSSYTSFYYEKDIQEFMLFLTEQGIDTFLEVSYQSVRIYLTYLYERKLARRTVARKISSLRSFYQFLLRDYEFPENPFSFVHMPKKDLRIPHFLYEEELEQLFQVCEIDTAIGQRNKAILELLYATGIRVSECCQIRIKDIDLSLGTVLVFGKGRKERYVPFGSFAQNALECYIHQGRKQLLDKSTEQTDKLFLNYRGGALTDRGIRMVLNDLIKKASLTIHISPHVLRHTFATHLLNEGADLRSVQELLGHAHLSSTQVYTHVTKDRLRNTYMNCHPRA